MLFPSHPFLFLVVNCYFISHASSTKRICKPAHSSTLTEPLFKALDIFHAVPRPFSRPPFIYHPIATPSPSPCAQRCTQHIYGHPITTYRHSPSCTLREGAARRCNVYRFFQHLCPACCNLISDRRDERRYEGSITPLPIARMNVLKSRNVKKETHTKATFEIKRKPVLSPPFSSSLTINKENKETQEKLPPSLRPGTVSHLAAPRQLRLFHPGYILLDVCDISMLPHVTPFPPSLAFTPPTSEVPHLDFVSSDCTAEPQE